MDRVVFTLDDESYRKIKYPGGELQVRLTADAAERTAKASAIAVVARIHNSEDLMELCLLCDAIESVANKGSHTSVLLPYLPYARADRRFVDGDCFGLGVFSKILSTLDAKIITLDAHSAKSIEQIKNLTDVSVQPIVADVIRQYATENKTSTVTVLFPDEGAHKRYVLPTRVGDVTVRVLYCSKKRNPETGKLVGFNVPAFDEFPTTDGKADPILMIDDICDGGGTFLGIADALKQHHLSLALYVTHGIFSKGLEQLEQRFAIIFTTDSFKERESTSQLRVLSSIPILLDAAKKHVANNVS